MKLLSSQKSRVRDIIQSYDLPEEEFTWEDQDAEAQPGVCLRHKPTDSYFRLQHINGDIFDCYRNPGDTNELEHFPRKRWMEIEKLIERWVRRVNTERKAEIKRRVLEEAATRFPPETLLDDPDFYKDSPFSPDEIGQIHLHLDGFEARLSELFDFTQFQAQVLSEEIRFSKEAAEKHGRRTWKRIFEGMLLGFGYQLGFEVRRAALKLGLAWMYKLLSRTSDFSRNFSSSDGLT